jgi:ribosome-binding ATPase YchF (GTP1/OBG family)
MAIVADDRLEPLARVESSKKLTPAAIRVIDVPGSGAALLGNLRSVDAILAVVDGFSPDADPEADLETLRLELLVADRDHVERRRERVAKDVKSGKPEPRVELADLDTLLAHLDAGGSMVDYSGTVPPALEPLGTKPLLEIVNAPGGVDAKLEAELAELPEDEAAAFRDGPSALDDVTRRLFANLELLTFFTIGDQEARAWTLARGKTALEAAATIHTDIARGFIRCEVIVWSDLVELGSRAAVSREGKQRLEGKEYVVQDGDVLNIRFNV